MTEERMHAILFATTLLCARKIIETIDKSTDKCTAWRAPGLEIFERGAMEQVEKLMVLIDLFRVLHRPPISRVLLRDNQ